MKKIFKLFGILFVTGTILCMASCDELFNLSLGDDPQEEDYSEPINHTFIKDSTDTGYFVCHYNAQNIFTYKNFKNCYYQIEFTFTTPRKFSLYSRTKESTAIIDTIASGTFTGDPLKEGNVTLTVSEGSISFQNITIAENESGILCFTGNVAASHKAIGAKDAK